MSSLKEDLEKEYQQILGEYKAVQQQYRQIKIEKFEAMQTSIKSLDNAGESPAKMEEAKYYKKEVYRRQEELDRIITPRLQELEMRAKEIKDEYRKITAQEERETTYYTNRERLLDKEIELERLRRENNKASMQELDDFYNKL